MTSFRLNGVGRAALAIAGMSYPAVVYFGRSAVSSEAFIAAAVVIIGTRVATLTPAGARLWKRPLLIAVAAIILVAVLSPALAVKAYPVVLSLAAALAFAVTLFSPPSLIERFARLHDPELSPAGQAYCRRVTWVWTCWLLINALIAGILGLSGHDAAWALWTGFIAYLIMGGLFAGEFVVRQIVRGRVAPQ